MFHVAPSPISDGSETVIDFGTVTPTTLGPSTGERYRVRDTKGSHLVATVELEIVELGEPGFAAGATDHDDLPSKSFSAADPLRQRTSLGPRRSVVTPRLDEDAFLPNVRLFARVASKEGNGTSVRLALGDDVDWSTSSAGLELDFGEVLVADGLRPGDRVICQLSLFAPDVAAGQQRIRVQFNAR